jgi:hypothetical protein
MSTSTLQDDELSNITNPELRGSKLLPANKSDPEAKLIIFLGFFEKQQLQATLGSSHLLLSWTHETARDS